MTAKAIVAMTLAAAAGLACAAGPVEQNGEPQVTLSPDSCSGARPDFGGVATAEDRALFGYDVAAPLNLQRTVESTSDGVEVSRIAFGSPDGGLVTGLMWDPVTRSSLRPGMVLLHGHPATARDMSGIAQSYALHGAVVVAIDAPFARRTGGPVGLTFLPQDRAEQIQLMMELQRAVDVLRARVNVDEERMAYLGISYGGAMGALFAGIEPRLKTAVLVVADGGLVSHFTGPEDASFMAGLSCELRASWFRDMAPIEPIRFIAHASPTALLLQSGRLDSLVPVADAQALHAAAPEPRTVRWYEAGHGLDPQAAVDRLDWLRQEIGLDAGP